VSNPLTEVQDLGILRIEIGKYFRHQTGPILGDQSLPGVQSMSSAMQSKATADRETTGESELLSLFAQWMDGVGPVSDTREILSHPAYKRIVEMGKPAVPLILRRLRREPSLLAWALFDITGTNPVRPSDYGNIKKITKAWLKWGKKNNYI
jgi:hypothetical protein